MVLYLATVESEDTTFNPELVIQDLNPGFSNHRFEDAILFYLEIPDSASDPIILDPKLNPILLSRLIVLKMLFYSIWKYQSQRPIQ